MAFQQQEPIAIVGSGCRFPGGAGSPSALWKLLKNPRDVCVNIPQDRFDGTGYYHPNGSHHGATNVRQSYFLEEDIRVFDATFFNISPNEADSMDPQQRLLLETVYEALESGGHTIDALRGSDTSVYVGTMSVDYYDTLLRDLKTIPTHFATGTNRAIISNRVSYFFNWHGPSMTIDTACSSSLIAVHQGVKALRSGESRVALACGTQVILNPEMYVAESKMKMLSPTGRCRMWDADADGYARGEGVAAVVLKRLSDALADGDHIECVIRETGTNQDGFSNGITVPSTEAQTALIRQTYAKAGLFPEEKPQDRPQFFEAHGTGTQAGDPKEAAAIHQSFGQYSTTTTPLYVGSVKTVIGHLEGAAGLAGLLKGSSMIQEGLMPPNLLFNRLNPRVEPFYRGLHVPTELSPWPKLDEGVPRRVSVNSFGFGGSNAHAILEGYSDARDQTSTTQTPVTPFVFSAASEFSLIAQLHAYSNHLRLNIDIDASDLSWTLQSRRSQLPTKTAFCALSIEQLASKIDAKLAILDKNPGTTIGIKSKASSASTRILGIFTGQGAQWNAMGAELIRSSEFVRKIVQDLEQSLATLPSSDRPQWNLLDEMLGGNDPSRISEAALSQPLCTALQIVLVDLFRAAGITFSAVVGHSSGEIAAAYTAGFLSAHDAIRIAYYRGFYAKLAGNTENGQKGAMLAVGTSLQDAQDLISLKLFKGRLAVAAHNSSASVTLSGDADAITHAKKVFDEEKKFARLLIVDTAYHSHHMFSCSEPYVQSLRACGVRVNQERNDTTCTWFSSVTPNEEGMGPIEELQDTYWRDNMTNTVLFADAVKNAVTNDDQLSFAIEVGPHPALKGPATQTISDVRPATLPYCGALSRGKNAIEAFSDALGVMWTHLGAQAIDFQSYEKAMTGQSRQPKLVIGLPSYQWNHERSHWNESRVSRKTRGRNRPPHELLGILSPDSNARDIRWVNVLKISEIPWLDGHKLQGQNVFPAAGYIAMALEASRSISADKNVELFELHNLSLPRAITFDDGDSSGVETLVTLTATQYHDNQMITADFSCYSVPVSSTGLQPDMELMASGTVKVVLGTPDIDSLFCTPAEDYNMSKVDSTHFYSCLSKLGYGYDGVFKEMSSMKRKLNQSSVLASTYPYTAEDSMYLVHPSTLDIAFQSTMLAYSAPGDDRLWSLHVPTAIGSIRVNPAVCISVPAAGCQVPVCSVLDSVSGSFTAGIDIFSEDGQHGMIQVEDFQISPFAPATERDDRRLFTYTKFDFASPNGSSVVENTSPGDDEIELATVCERISYHYHRKWNSEITEDDWKNGQPHHLHLRNWIKHTLSMASSGQHATLKKEWSKDSPADIKKLMDRFPDSVDVRLLRAVGENIPAAVRGETTILEHMLPDNLLDDFYKQGVGIHRYNLFLSAMLTQITHRYPHAKILEIGAGTGGATKSVLESVGKTMSSYTYTDISAGFFNRAVELFKTYNDKMTFKVLDIEKAPAAQGYELQSYDIIIASNVLHATVSLQATLENTRKLLKPGGYLMMLEITNQGPIRFGNVMAGLSGWWLGVDDGRIHAPTVSPGEWHSALRKSGFSGVDAITPEVDGVTWPLSIIAAQAVDDRVQFLRRPLASSKSSIYLESLIILGNKTLETSRIAEEVAEHLTRFCGELTILDSLPTESEALNLNPMSTFLNLVDIDSPIFKEVTSEKMDGLKRMFELANHILWITQGAQIDQPYHQASIAFSRAIRNEAGHISINHLDISKLKENVPKFIAEYLLQQRALDEWEATGGEQQHRPLLWSKEPEAFLDDGKLKVPRLLSHIDQNARLNSSRRLFTKTVQISDPITPVSLSNDLQPSLIEQVLAVTNKHDHSQSITAESSSLTAIHVTLDTYLFLSIGKEKTAKNHVATLSTTNSFEVTPIITVATESSANDENIQSADHLLIVVASEIVAKSLVQPLSSGSHILVYCSSKDRFLTQAISRRAAAKNIRSTFVCDAESVGEDPTWIELSAHSSKYVLRSMLHLAKPTHFLDLTTAAHSSSDLSLRITQALPSGYKHIETSSLFQKQSSLPASYDRESLIDILEDAVLGARASSSSTSQEQVQDLILQLNQIRGSPALDCVTSGVHWPSNGPVQVEIRPLDPTTLFSENKTYILAGLSGKIGQSLCEWMISNGAKCVCLTSRKPAIEKRWLESFHGTGANVKIYPMDVTDKRSLESVIEDIRATCPPIAGVANGAMVLSDALFSNMSLDAMRQVLGPKIDGSKNLDDLFHDQALDFFVLFSSSASVIGNSGQSNYAAANGYINTLVRQRRRRGLAASTFDIGRVVGIGYVENAGEAVSDHLARMGLAALSEPDLQLAFAETIQAGYSNAKDKNGIPEAVVTTGIRTIRDDEEIKGPWFSNPLFSHCIIDSESAKSGVEGQKDRTMMPVGQQLSKAVTKEQTLEILKECFSAKLRAILQLSDEKMDYDAPLVEVGIDSLVAVEARSWFLKELKVDVPVLKLVGGASITEICQTALERLPGGLLASIGKQDVEPRKSFLTPSPITVRTKHQLSESGTTAASASGYNSGSEALDLSHSQSSATTPSSPRSVSANELPDEIVVNESKILRTLPTPAPEPLPRKFVKTEPISLSQSRFWFLRLLLEDQSTYNVCFYYHVIGELRVGDLERALRMVTSRHEALRTCFIEDQTDSSNAYQKVLASSPIRLESKKINSFGDVATEYNKLKSHQFDLASGELLKLAVLTLSPSSHYLMVNHHHIIMDGVSFQVFLSDLEKAYNRQSLGPLPRQYPAISAAQRQAFEKGKLAEELMYWKTVFPAGEQPPVLPLFPMARVSSRVAMKTFDTHQVAYHLEPELTARIKQVSRSQRSTPFHFYLATFKAMLFCFTGTKDLTIGIADAARNDSDVMGSIGFFLNLLTLRFYRQPDQTFSDAVVEARNTTYAALGNSRLPFDVLLSELNVARSSTHSPFFQAFLDYRQGAQEKHPWGNCQFELEEAHPGRTAYDISLDVADSATDALITIRAQKSLYDLTAANLLLETFIHLLDFLSSDPSIALHTVPLFGQKQLSQAVNLGRGSYLISDWPETLPNRIEQIAQKNPERTALMDGVGNVLTYSDMISRIEAISEALQNVGVGSGSRVLVFQEAASDWVCSMLAIMRIGGIYVPLDLQNPMPRLAAVAKDCEATAIVADASTLNDAHHLEVSHAHIINVSALARKPSVSIDNYAKADSPAAILYTSGSTGTPKGIIVTHAGLRNEIEGYTKTWGLGAERTLQQSAFTFNHSSDQIYTGLVNGGMVYIVPTNKRGDPLEITKIIQENEITYTKATPSEYLIWVEHASHSLRQASHWRFAFGGGEPLTKTVVNEFANLGLSDLRFFNSYGPTEISISCHKMEIAYREKEIMESMGRIPCGYSLPNYHTYILDEQLKPLPPGMPGEVYIGGAGVSIGYLNNQELSNQHFVPNPYATPEDISHGWTRMYRTNDIGHLADNGALVFHNRIAGDTQVKIRGLRIELTDIESNIIAASKGVLKEAVVTLREGDPQFLVAHVVFALHQNIMDKEGFMEHLLSKLPIPQYMIPVVAIPLDKLPLNNHSKVDRKAVKDMPLPLRSSSVHEVGEAEMTEVMVQLKAVWRDVFGKEAEKLGLDITPSTNFFLVGGNSLLAIRLQSQIRKVFNVAIRLVDLLDAAILGDMARKIEESPSVDAIDWERETAPPSVPNFLKGSLAHASSAGGHEKFKKTILVTGSTGFLAKHLIPYLAGLSEVGTIHCVAVRDTQKSVSYSPKVICHKGNLSLPQLGLPEDEYKELANQINVILHLGGVRSFWDNYHVLRPSNVNGTRELVQLAGLRRVPIHYISTVGVLPRNSVNIKATSAADYLPTTDGSNGYVATRWASERILERSGASLGVPSKIYRFLPNPTLKSEHESTKEVLEEFLRFIDKSGMIPDTTGWTGTMNMAPVAQVVQLLCKNLFPQESDSKPATTQFIHYQSPIAIDVEQLNEYIKEHRGKDQGLKRIPILKWIGRIKALGFDYLLTTQDAAVESQSGGLGKSTFESRR